MSADEGRGAARAGSADRIAGGVLITAAVAVGIEATTFDVAFLTDPVGPKALPFVVAIMLAAGGGRTLAKPRDAVELPGRSGLSRMAAALGVLLLYAILLPWIGFFLSTTAVVAGLGILFGGPWKGGLATGLTLSAALWLLFVALLSLPLPIGDLWIR